MTGSIGAHRRMWTKLALSLAIMLLAFFSITSGSMWTDEILRVQAAVQHDFPATVSFSLRCGQPGYMILEHFYVLLLGNNTGEFALRCSNLIFAAAAIYFVFKIIDAKKWPLWTSLVFFFHPMFVYYMDEVTPYILIYAIALAFIYHVFFAADFNSRKNIITINAIFLLGVVVHFVFGFVILLYFARCWLTIRRDKKLVLRHAGIMAAFCVAYLPFLYVILVHMKGTATGFSLRNLLYVVYSFLGMAGLSLSRSDLRAGNFDKLEPLHIALPVIFALVVLGLMVLAFTSKSKFLSKNREMLIGLLSYLVVMVLAAVFARFGVWERHCMAVFPVYIILLVDLMLDLGGSRPGKILLALFFGFMLLSSANLRLDYYYACDDYQGVANEIRAAMDADDSLVLVTDRATDYYDRYYEIGGMADEPGQLVVDTWGMSDEDEQAIFLDYVKQGRSAMLLLFEKSCSRAAYEAFDDNPAYTVDASYNTFKIVTPNK